jgi:DNA-binding transcriptional regulator of glucitol operon
MSRRTPMSPRAKRAWGIGLLVFFVVMCVMIAWSQWYAINVNVPAYESKQRAGRSK